MGNFLRKCWEEHGATVQHHVVNMLTINTSHQSHPLGLKWQYIQNDSLPVLCGNIYIRPC